MAASSDLQTLQLENRNLQQKLDWKQLKINQLETKVRDLRGGGLAADLGRLERSIGRLSLQMEHVQLVIKRPEWSFHTFAMPETTASSAHTIFVRPPSGDRIEVTIPPGKQPGELFTVMLKDEDAYPTDWPWFAAPPAAPAHSAPPPWAAEQQQQQQQQQENANPESAEDRDARVRQRRAEQRRASRAAETLRRGGEPGSHANRYGQGDGSSSPTHERGE
ncbi:hypothetical protein EMIHUDRAFT_115441 [Emiliania huxleyi CCMP1516]|uniref:CS domain-containing protein n=2 Tax=Emiliania huxleyi TaxID=2903 RepID=A0A0D3JPW9_EMIH1|nr:hypothetical protein EMIHUDRAFT_115441 [Emiliania huxleyi CCMP1516]EOD25554.1 hypothetical protein EMIHUDRAFT_115441 [Emiliania huxleyi CCMP1516]|eukprot:XP_005777983.1 hypothetical protein EMIHUDRAFT_115441 [Emiliania huxleyi CCMP1516]